MRIHQGRTIPGFVIALVTSALTGLVSHAGTVYVSNTNTNSIDAIAPNGTVTTYASGIDQPEGVAFDGSGNLYAADDTDGIISKITPGGNVSVFASGLEFPQGLAFDSSGNLYVADLGPTHVIYKITPAGTKTAFYTASGNFTGIAFDKSGDLYAGYGYYDIIEITPGGTVNTISTTAYNAHQLAFDSSGNLYAAISATANTPAQIEKFAPGGGESAFATFGAIAATGGLAFDGSNNLYAIIGLNSIAKFAPDGSEVTFATGLSGASYLTYSSAPEPSSLTILSFGGMALLARRRVTR